MGFRHENDYWSSESRNTLSFFIVWINIHVLQLTDTIPIQYKLPLWHYTTYLLHITAQFWGHQECEQTLHVYQNVFMLKMFVMIVVSQLWPFHCIYFINPIVIRSSTEHHKNDNLLLYIPVCIIIIIIWIYIIVIVIIVIIIVIIVIIIIIINTMFYIFTWKAMIQKYPKQNVSMWLSKLYLLTSALHRNINARVLPDGKQI